MSDPAYVAAVVALVRERVNFTHEIPDFADYLFGPITSFEEAYHTKQWKEGVPERMTELANRLDGLGEVEWTIESIERVIRGYAEELEVGAGKLIHPLRLSITGKKVGAGMFETMEVLGRELTLERMRHYIEQHPV